MVARIDEAPGTLPADDVPAPAVIDGVVSRGPLLARVGATRLTTVLAPPGSGKTFLLRSWAHEAVPADRVARVTVKCNERNPQRFWVAVADALRATSVGAGLIRPLTPAPDLDGWAIVERLVEDLAGLDERVWLVIDDVHEQASDDAQSQLELLVLRTPPELRLVLTARSDLRLRLHRLRLEGELSELRAGDLRFTVDEARAMFDASGVVLPEPVVRRLHARAEGWPAGLRLAALSLAGHPDPERFAGEFSGSERTVADYLLTEVLERQADDVQRLLLRTSVLSRVNGELADLLGGGSGGQRTLQDLEAAGVFVTAVDAGRSWFRYHQLFADLLQAELRRIAPEEPRLLHATAARWFAQHGHLLEAIRHAQAARDWESAARLLADHWVDLQLNGRAATAHELLAGFPPAVLGDDAELLVLKAADELARGFRQEAERQLVLAVERSGSVEPEHRDRFQVLLAIAHLSAARQRGDLADMARQADLLRATVGATDAALAGVSADLRALAAISLGIAEACAAMLEEAQLHVEEAERRLERADRCLEEGIALARRIGRPFLEFVASAHAAGVATYRGLPAEPRSRRAIELADRHGWSDEQAAGRAYLALGAELVGHGRLEEGERWLERAGRTLRPEAEPALGVALHSTRGLLGLAAGRWEDALADFRSGDRLAGSLSPPTAPPHALSAGMRGRVLLPLVRLGRLDRAEALLAGTSDRERAPLELRTARAALRLGQDDAPGALDELGPEAGHSAQGVHPVWMAAALLVRAITQDALGDEEAAGRTLERSLGVAGPDRWLLPYLLHPAPDLLDRHARRGTAHAGFVSEVLGLLAGKTPPAVDGPPADEGDGAAVPAPLPVRPAALREPLSQAETRVLRFLPTTMSVPEIAGELYLSVNTVRTHLRHIYDKLDAHRRHEAIERARALGLVAPSHR